MKEVKKHPEMGKWKSETLGKINQMQFRATSFWQVACSLHAFCMHTCQDWVSQKWIYFDECSWCTHHLSVLQLPIDRFACIFSSMKSRMCATCQDCVFCMQSQSPIDMWPTRPLTLCRVFFFWKGGSTKFEKQNKNGQTRTTKSSSCSSFCKTTFISEVSSSEINYKAPNLDHHDLREWPETAFPDAARQDGPRTACPRVRSE